MRRTTFVVFLVLLTWVVFFATIEILDDYRFRAETQDDKPSYIAIARAIRSWSFRGVGVTHSWGLPYSAAGLSILLGISELAAIAIISLVAAIAAAYCIIELHGEWVAATFVVINWDWIQTSVLGGAEPLFAAFLFSSMLLYRRGRVFPAALLAALATTVRAPGFLLLVALGLDLLRTRRWGDFVKALLGATAIGALSIAPWIAQYQDPLVSIRWYERMGWGQAETFIPLFSITKAFLGGETPATNFAQMLAWELLLVAGVLALVFTERGRDLLKRAPVEGLFFGAYGLLMLTLPAWWLGDELGRYAIPILPTLLAAISPMLPEKRLPYVMLAIGSSATAAISSIGFRSLG